MELVCPTTKKWLEQSPLEILFSPQKTEKQKINPLLFSKNKKNSHFYFQSVH